MSESEQDKPEEPAGDAVAPDDLSGGEEEEADEEEEEEAKE